MILDKIVDEIIEKIEKATKMDKKVLKRALEVSSMSNKPNCTLFLLRIRKDAKDFAENFYNEIVDANIEIIKDLTLKGLEPKDQSVTNKNIDLKDLSLSSKPTKDNGPSISFNINMKLYFANILKMISEKKEDFGSNKLGEGKTILIDFSSPNIAKIFHIGHFRTTVLGNFVKKLYLFCGYKTVGINYLGDWGKQFGLVLLGYKLHGSEEELENDPIKHLFDVYVKINKDVENDPTLDDKAKEIFMKMEKEKNEEYLDLWKKFRAKSIEKYKKLYKRMNIEFDEYSGESLYEEKGKQIVETLPFLVEKKDGSKAVDLGKLGMPMIIKGDGTSLYLTRDIAAVVDRCERFSPEKIIYVVSSEQNLYFEQLKATVKKMGYDEKILQHINFGLVSGMSTRKGTVKFLEDIIDLATDVMKDEINQNPEKAAKIADIDYTALQLAISTLVIMDFSAKRIKGYEFDVEKRAKNVNGTGPYFQYAHCRLNSIQERNSHLSIEDLSSIDFDLISNDDVFQIVYKFIWFEKLIVCCLDDHEPSKIVTYMQDLCGTINFIVDKYKVLGVEEDLAKSRLLVLSCAKIVLGNALRLLGCNPLLKM
ncbi:Arginyl-tRNA synthetase, cytoplasmic [Nosema bombycis CQ1]|uniref:arginine--tRNA ligase n=1 Tax=Nosema bombycis (strain CQ1 / CVCC 102059) TaxID=578461 RepID=R0KT34_NOSB1|nr:Arginyl-tRNA synthetase, cytoplasmic [Nosema bombycis CQ1]|eukprot:EOB13372.1 Arginyl-tRNA synthetase, cytoplasmic [Nosema bombycis CQ1]